ncbi:MAG: PTS sugar transporter subunit IIA [Xanthomonadales bacterium]|nr:PTS sugar transporter subunit IIA [Xanthomonadales bacterium]
MKIIDILEENKILMNYHFISKKRLFETIAEILGGNPQEVNSIYHGLVEREKLGNTSLGNGVAVPHGKCEGIEEIKACVIKLSQGADYESIDDVAVNVVIGIAFPEKTHVSHRTLMKDTAHLFRQHRLYKKMMLAENREQFMAEIMNGFQLCNS